jgi:hypothetical protein
MPRWTHSTLNANNVTDKNPCCRDKYKYIIHETAICRNPHKSSNQDSHITRQVSYKHTSCQNAMSKKKVACLYIFVKTKHVGLLISCQFFLSPIKLCIGGL